MVPPATPSDRDALRLTPKVLASNSHGHASLLLNARIINDEPRARRSTQQVTGAAGHLVHQWTMHPRRVADKVFCSLW